MMGNNMNCNYNELGIPWAMVLIKKLIITMSDISDHIWSIYYVMASVLRT